MKEGQLVTVLQDMVLTWYIKLCMDQPTMMMEETQQALKNEFKKPKSRVQYVTMFKEIQKRVNNSTWDFNQKLKCVIL